MGDIIVLSVLGLIVGLIVFSLIRDKKKGKSGCSCGCQNCSRKDFCHPSPENKQEPK
jgi:hypothetical protein